MPRKSTIEQLPPDILEKLQELLRDPRVTQLEVTEQINAVLSAQGYDDRISKSAVNRYSIGMQKVGEKLQQSREVAKMWIGKLGDQPQTQVGKLVNEIIRTLAFDAAMQFAEGEEPIEPKMLKDLAIAVERLERAAGQNAKRDEEIRKQALNDAADIVEENAKAQGMNDEQAKFWREKFLGVK